MSCFKRQKTVSVAQGSVGVNKGVQQTVPVATSPPASCEKVWSLSEFSVLHELQKPIVIVSPGVYKTTKRRVD